MTPPETSPSHEPYWQGWEDGVEMGYRRALLDLERLTRKGDPFVARLENARAETRKAGSQ